MWWGLSIRPVAVRVFLMRPMRWNPTPDTFEEEGALDKLEAFASEHGPRFYGLPLNNRKIRLVREETPVPEVMEAAGSHITPFHAGEPLAWRFEGII